jgi:hypothetical protein
MALALAKMANNGAVYQLLKSHLTRNGEKQREASTLASAVIIIIISIITARKQ